MKSQRGGFVLGLGLFRQAEGAHAAFGAGPRTQDDAFPDMRFGFVDVALRQVVGLLGQCLEALGAIIGRGLVLNVRPAALQLADALVHFGRRREGNGGKQTRHARQQTGGRIAQANILFHD